MTRPTIRRRRQQQRRAREIVRILKDEIRRQVHSTVENEIRKQRRCALNDKKFIRAYADLPYSDFLNPALIRKKQIRSIVELAGPDEDGDYKYEIVLRNSGAMCVYSAEKLV